MRHRRIWKRARFIDEFIDAYRKVRRLTNFPHKAVKTILPLIFPGSKFAGKGAFKTVHKVSSRAKDLVLKTSRARHAKRGLRAYRMLPKTKRNRYFAKIYWKTKYCVLQKYGKKVTIPKRELTKLKIFAATYGLTDIRPDNIRKVDGRLKIVDANVKGKRP